MLDQPRSRRIITIDGNEEIHRDFEAVLKAPGPDGHLDELEAAGFGGSMQKVPEPISYDLDHALQGEEGVEKVSRAVAEGRPYALAFVGMRMPPGWDGIETIRRIWKVDPAVQIVICTAYSDCDLSGLRRHFRRTDSLLILKKPFDTEEVEQLASTLTRKWSLARQAAMRMDELERLVQKRTADLADANRRLVEEISRRTASEEALRRLSLLDALTGIANRRVFDEMLATHWAQAIEQASSISLLMIDLDYFKHYNDRRGHLAGDECLKRVATALHGSTARHWDLLARYGGEEFAAILPKTDLPGALSVGERMRAVVESLGIPHEDSPTALGITVSVGCAAMAPSKGMAPRMLIAVADQALYRAKEMGRNRIAQ